MPSLLSVIRLMTLRDWIHLVDFPLLYKRDNFYDLLYTKKESKFFPFRLDPFTEVS